ncbi:MAG: GNAT family N-acetyltransferase [Deltaproteobacteria bacterium]|nr:GNAT family N-acetyltransferase [Deltaproteobacteria bacterium]
MEPDTYRVRPARPEDAARIAPLAAALVRMHHQLDPLRFLCVDGLEEGYARFLRTASEDPRSVVLVAEGPGGVVLGYAYGALEPRDWNTLLDACGVLHDILVAPEARALGLGRALADQALARLFALGAPRVVLRAAWQNPAARAFFEGLGFRSTMVEMTLERPAEGTP